MGGIFGSGVGESGGSGDVTGPGSSTNNDIAVFSGTTGKIIADSGVSISSISGGPFLPLAGGTITGDFAVDGTTSLDAGQITTDGDGDLTIQSFGSTTALAVTGSPGYNAIDAASGPYTANLADISNGAAGYFSDGSGNLTELTNGSQAIASSGNGFTANLADNNNNAAGFFQDTPGNTVHLAADAYAVFGASANTPSTYAGYFQDYAGSYLAWFGQYGGPAAFFSDSSGNQAIIADDSYAFTSSNSSTAVHLSDVNNEIAGRFDVFGGSGSGGVTTYIADGQRGSNGSAIYALDGTNSVEIATGFAAMNVVGVSNFQGSGAGGATIATMDSLGDFNAELSLGNGLGAGYAAAFYDLNGNIVTVANGTNAITSTGPVQMQGLTQGVGPPGTILTNFQLYVNTLTGAVFVN